MGTPGSSHATAKDSPPSSRETVSPQRSGAASGHEVVETVRPPAGHGEEEVQLGGGWEVGLSQGGRHPPPKYPAHATIFRVALGPGGRVGSPSLRKEQDAPCREPQSFSSQQAPEGAWREPCGTRCWRRSPEGRSSPIPPPRSPPAAWRTSMSSSTGTGSQMTALSAFAPTPAMLVRGGKERQDSVSAALAALPGDIGHVFIHDCARPLIRPEQLVALHKIVRRSRAVVLAHRVTDTIKEKRPGGRLRTVDRSRLWAMETPQVFSRDLIERAYAQVSSRRIKVTDDAAAVEALGHPVELLENPHPNPKLTSPQDLALPRIPVGYGLLRDHDRGPCPIESATGTTSTAPWPAGRWSWAGVRFESAFGLEGHSDADCVTHAICDAFLGRRGPAGHRQLFPGHRPHLAQRRFADPAQARGPGAPGERLEARQPGRDGDRRGPADLGPDRRHEGRPRLLDRAPVLRDRAQGDDERGDRRHRARAWRSRPTPWP